MNEKLMKVLLERMSYIKENQSKVLEGDLVDFQYGFDVTSGLCSNIANYFIEELKISDYHKVREWLEKTFVKLGFDPTYPIEGCWDDYVQNVNKYVGNSYAVRRWDLLDLLIKEAKQFK